MATVSKDKRQQPEALAELARASREQNPGDAPRELTATAKNKPLPAENELKHDVAERLLSAGAHGEKMNPHDAGADALPDRTRIKKQKDGTKSSVERS